MIYVSTSVCFFFCYSLLLLLLGICIIFFSLMIYSRRNNDIMIDYRFRPMKDCNKNVSHSIIILYCSDETLVLPTAAAAECNWLRSTLERQILARVLFNVRIILTRCLYNINIILWKYVDCSTILQVGTAIRTSSATFRRLIAIKHNIITHNFDFFLDTLFLIYKDVF